MISDICVEQLFSKKVKVYISACFTYHQCDKISGVLNLDQGEQNVMWIPCIQILIILAKAAASCMLPTFIIYVLQKD